MTLSLRSISALNFSMVLWKKKKKRKRRTMACQMRKETPYVVAGLSSEENVII